MKTIRISEFKNHIGEEVKIQGWIFNKRGNGKIYFLQLRDGSGFTQGVAAQGEASEEVMEKAGTLTPETSLKVTGIVKAHPKKENVFEMQVTGIEIVQLVEEEYPITKKEHGPDFLLNNRHLWLRSKKQIAIQRVRNTIINATYEHLNNEGYLKIDAPILTPNACEGTTELFELDYFEEGSAFLSQSGQLYIEAAIFAHGRCFDFGPVFRAEKSKTRRHLTEFWMMDAEAAFVEHKENMEIQEKLLKHIVKNVLEVNKADLEILERDIEPLNHVINNPFIIKTHSEVVAELKAMGSSIGEMDDLGAEDETMLTEKYQSPIFVEKYPAEVKAFYMKRDPNNPKFALCSDLLAPEGYGEIIGGSEREENYEELLKRIKDHNLPEDSFKWYLDLRKYGSVPHSGFGFGLERIVTWLTGINHVRETIPFPRMIHRIHP